MANNVLLVTTVLVVGVPRPVAFASQLAIQAEDVALCLVGKFRGVIADVTVVSPEIHHGSTSRLHLTTEGGGHEGVFRACDQQ